MLGSGVVGAPITGVVLDKTRAYKKILVAMFMVSIVAFGLTMYSCLEEESNRSLVKLWMVFLGASMVSVMPVGLGLGIELTYPLQPALSNGTMMMCA